MALTFHGLCFKPYEIVSVSSTRLLDGGVRIEIVTEGDGDNLFIELPESSAQRFAEQVETAVNRALDEVGNT